MCALQERRGAARFLLSLALGRQQRGRNDAHAVRPATRLLPPAAGSAPTVMRLRVVTYNVHRFVADGESTVDVISSAMRELAPDILALNEVSSSKEDVHGATPSCLTRVASETGLPYIHFFGHVRGRYGNALLSRYPLRVRAEVHLDGGSEVVFPAGTVKLNDDVAQPGERHTIVRGLLLADIELPATPGEARPRLLELAATHLDHMDVRQRRTQLEHVVRAMQRADGEPQPCASLVLGDLNALTRADYSDARWGELEARARANAWQLPAAGDDLDVLRAAGFRDAAASENVAMTSPAGGGCRIDYAWLRRGATGDDACVVRSFVAADVAASDHWPVVTDLVFGEIAQRAITRSCL